MVSGSNVLVTYQDGSTFESAIYGDELWDGDGHLLQFYLRNTQDASIRYKAMEYDIPEGTYTLECEVDGTVWDSGATFRSVALSSATLQELGLGSTVIHMDSAHSHNWYQFTAPEDGRYMIRNCKNLWIYKKTEDGRNAVNHCIGSKDNTSVGYFNAKKDVTYFLGFGNYQSDQASDETITIEKIETKAIDHVNSVTIQNL